MKTLLFTVDAELAKAFLQCLKPETSEASVVVESIKDQFINQLLCSDETVAQLSPAAKAMASWPIVDAMPKRTKRHLSDTARKAISRAQKARWRKYHADKKGDIRRG